MNLKYSRRFVASFRGLTSDDKTAVIHALELFQDNPFDLSLANHALTGKMTGKRPFALAGDVRIVVTERSDHQDVTLLDVGSHSSVFHAAARGKRGRDDVEAFRSNLDAVLGALRRAILDGSVSVGTSRSFRIRDPKPRIIPAPVFRERVLHHAIMAHAGPVLDRALIFDSYAWRTGKGALAAVRRVRDHAGQYAWFTQIDISGYFAHIDHAVLLGLLARAFKDRGLLLLFSRIIAAHCDDPGRGLPIGALTSQHFANFYLAGADRLLLEDGPVRGVVRYMDDLIWWTDDRATAHATLLAIGELLRDTFCLTLKDPLRIGRSRHGIMFCGCRIQSGRLLLTRRRNRRYRQMRRDAEAAWRGGQIDATVAKYLCLRAGADIARRRVDVAERGVAPVPRCCRVGCGAKLAQDAGRNSAAKRVIRGGSWNNEARNVRAACRNGNDPSNRNDNLGFRCARAHVWTDVREWPGRCPRRPRLWPRSRRNATKAGVLVRSSESWPEGSPVAVSRFRQAPRMNADTSHSSTSGASTRTEWLLFSSSISRDPGIRPAISRENSGGQIQSCRPARISVGAVMRLSSGRRSNVRRKPVGPNARFSGSGEWIARPWVAAAARGSWRSA